MKRRNLVTYNHIKRAERSVDDKICIIMAMPDKMEIAYQKKGDTSETAKKYLKFKGDLK